MNYLLDQLAHDLGQMGYFFLFDDGTLVSTQEGVFRTNCIDCLDRTNVVQSMIAERVVNGVLSRLEILSRIEHHPNIKELFQRVTMQFAYTFLLQFAVPLY